MKPIGCVLARLAVASLAVFTCAPAHGQGVPELIYYKFNEGSGTSTVNYAVPGVGSAGTTHGHTLGSGGQFGGALNGAGGSSTTNFVDTGWVTALGTGSWTIGFWFDNTTTGAGTNLQYLFGDVTAGSLRIFSEGVAGTGNLILRGPVTDVILGGGASTTSANAVAWVYDSTVPEIRAYLNGALVNTVAQSGVNIAGTANLKVGGYSSSNALYVNGKMDEFRLYNRALSAAEIALTWNSDLLVPADLSITKTDGVVSATPGGSVTYTITASNAGPDPATGATVADTFPAILTPTWTCVGAGGGTCTASGAGNINDTVNLPAGGSVTYTASASINASATGTLSNTATVAAPGGVTDSNPSNNAATDTDTLTPQADLAITKTDGVTSATPGGSVTYTITASNAGPSNALGATVADTFPASLTPYWTCVGAGGGTCTASGAGNINDTVNLPAGGSVTYTVSASISAAATGTISNTATVAAPGGVTDPNPGNNSATDTDTLTPQADLAITKTDGVTSAVPGGSVTYTITASNAGPSNALGATVADTFPASLTPYWTCVGAGGGTCTASGAGNINDTVNLPAGGSVTYTVSASISAAATGTISNTATVAAPGGVTDPNPGNNSATDTDTLTPQADLAITKTDGVTSATPGGSVTYTITASNAGPSNAPGATVADTLPASLTATWTCVGAGGGTCTASSSGNINDTVNLPAGGSVTYTASASISASATGILSNTATVAPPGGVTDPNPVNNVATDADSLTPDTTPPTVTPPAAIAIDQTLCCGTSGGASPDSSAELLAFVNAGSATDDRDPSPTRLPARVGGTDVAGSTCFAAGMTTVTFRFQDSAGNVGTATSKATVRMFGDLNADAVFDPSDYVVMRAYFNFVIAPGTPPFIAPLGMADLNHDTVVDPSDTVLLRAFFNFVVGCLAP